MIQIIQTIIFFGIKNLILITGLASSTDETLFIKTSQCTTPMAYDVSLEIENVSLEIETRLLVVSSVILNVSCPQQYIRLYIKRDCELKNITVIPDVPHNLPAHWETTIENSTEKQFKSVDIRLIKRSRTGFRNERIKEIEKVRLHGLYTIYPIYNCNLEKVFATVSTYISQSGKKEFMILPRIPAEWIFPYWENPAIKAKFTIRITYEHTETALTNMPSTQYIPVKKLHRLFDTTPSISTHLIAVAIVPNVCVNYISLNEGKIRDKLWEKENTLYAQYLIFDIVTFIKNMWDDIIPQSRHVTFTVVPVYFSHYKSIVTTGLVLFSEADIIYNTEVDSIIKQKEVICLVARSVIQEMFSEWLPTFRQTDLWFIEGFSTIYGVYISDKHYQMSFLKLFVVETRREFLDYTEAFIKYDLSIQETSIISQNSTLRKLWRVKAFSTFYMLNTVFNGDFLYTSMFEEAINLYYNTFKTSTNAILFVTVSVTDSILNDTYDKQSFLDNKLWNLETFRHKSKYFKTINVKSMITSWTEQIGYPVVQVKRLNGIQILAIVVIDCFDVDPKVLCECKWWIPVTFYKITTTEVLTIHHHILKSYENSIITVPFISENESAIVVDSPGYRINYDRKSWNNIALYLKNEELNISKLSDVTLAQILDDAFYFLVQNTEYNENPASDDSDLHIYLDLANSIFHVNKSCIAWYPVLTAFEKISKIFLFPESFASTNIKDKLLEMLNRFLDDMSYTKFSENNVSNQLYHEVLKWTCIFGGSKCKEHVTEILEWHFIKPAKNKLLPSWQRWIYCQGLKLETLTYEMSALWQKILKIYQSQDKEGEFFEFLPCSKQYKNMYNFFRYLDDNSLPTPGNSLNAKISDTKNIVKKKKSDTVNFLFNMFALHSKNESALDIIIFGIENGIGRDVNILAILNCVINNIYSEKGLLMITNEMFLTKQLYIHQKKPFFFDAIKKKVENRRSFLVKMQNYIRHRPYYILTYKSITK